MGTSKLIDSSAASLFDVPGSNSPLVVQERQIGGTRSAISIAGSWLAFAMLVLPCAAGAQQLRPYTVSGDSIPESLTGTPGDPVRGRALVVERTSTCILCHSGPFPEEKFQGDLAPNLSGSGSRWSAGQLRLRLVDASRLNPATIMPSYYRLDELERVATAWRGKPILTAEQIEDIVAYLATLRK
jgi:L-cysteine S-thiosulfotransferase